MIAQSYPSLLPSVAIVGCCSHRSRTCVRACVDCGHGAYGLSHPNRPGDDAGAIIHSKMLRLRGGMYSSATR
jgi:hypothetical protein